MERGKILGPSCFNCWFYKDGLCEYETMKKEILRDESKSPEDKSRLTLELAEKAKRQGCPNII